MHNDMPIKHLNTAINTKINCKLRWQDTISLKTVDTVKLRFLEYFAWGILCKVQSTFLTKSNSHNVEFCLGYVKWVCRMLR